MATATDETTVSIRTPDGKESDPVTMSEFSERADQAVARMRQRQLTFDVGKAGGSPDFGSLKIAGDFGVGRDLRRRAEVTVTVTDQFGEVIASGDAVITSVQFKDKTDQHGNVLTERIHVATLGG